jgi:hypothetical protein
METAVFQDRGTKTSSDGNQLFLYGPFCDLIPDDAPQDWELGPKMRPGEFGIFLAHAWHPRGHSPYAVLTAKTSEDAKAGASRAVSADQTGRRQEPNR